MQLVTECYPDIKLDLWPTPKYITEMCLMTHSGPKIAEKRAALRAVNCYLAWVISFSDELRNGGITDPGAHEYIVEHFNYIKSSVNDTYEVMVYWV